MFGFGLVWLPLVEQKLSTRLVVVVVLVLVVCACATIRRDVR